jgi:MFS transporter, DHA1 family, tetracycline resistance protein
MADSAPPSGSRFSKDTSRGLFAIFITVFLDLLSFGMFIPDIQLRGQYLAQQMLGLTRDNTADPRLAVYVAALLAGYSLMQLVFAPILGQLSDRKGRRVVLLTSTMLSCLSYVLYAVAGNFWMLLISRMLVGVAASNLSVAFAYTADITTKEERPKALGLVGAALGLGFIFGPPVGGLLIRFADDATWLLGGTGAVLTLINLAFIFFFLKEPTHKQAPGATNLMKSLNVALQNPAMGVLLLMTFAFNLGFANLQSTFFLLLHDPRSIFNLSELKAKEFGSYIMGMVGLLGALMQAVVFPALSARFKGPTLLRLAFLCLIPSFLLLPFSPLWGGVIAVCALMGFGSGLAQPLLNSMVSRNAPAEIQGSIFGVTQSTGAVARLIGPALSPILFHFAVFWPYVAGAVCFAVGAIMAFFFRPEETADR